MFVSKLLNTLLLCTALVSAGAAGLMMGGQAPERASSPKIVTINIMKVLNSHKGLAAKNDEVKQMAIEKQAEIDVMKGEIDKLLDEMSMYARGSHEYVTRDYEVERRRLAFEQNMKLMQRDLSREQNEAVKAAIIDVENAIAAYSAENGIEVVLTTPYSIEELKESDPSRIVKWLDAVHVLWSHDALDISDTVITIVNGS